MFDSPFSYERSLDSVSRGIEHHVHSLQEAQKALKDIAHGKSFLLIDTTLGRPPMTLHRSFDRLRAKNWDQLADLYIQKLYGGHIPNNSQEVFQKFLGPDIQLMSYDVHDESLPSLDHIDAVLLSGSPADVTKAFSAPGLELDPGLNQSMIYQRATEMYRRAAKGRLPVFGICYGHQIVTQANGGEVIRGGVETAEEGLGSVEETAYGSTLLAATQLALPGSLTGDIASYHNEVVRPNKTHSTMFLRNSSTQPEIVHGLIHVPDMAFTGDPTQDAEMIQAMLGEGRHVALTVQGHPEATQAEHLAMFELKQGEHAFYGHGEDTVVANMLMLFSRFLEQHQRFKSPHTLH